MHHDSDKDRSTLIDKNVNIHRLRFSSFTIHLTSHHNRRRPTFCENKVLTFQVLSRIIIHPFDAMNIQMLSLWFNSTQWLNKSKWWSWTIYRLYKKLNGLKWNLKLEFQSNVSDFVRHNVCIVAWNVLTSKDENHEQCIFPVLSVMFTSFNLNTNYADTNVYCCINI